MFRFLPALMAMIFFAAPAAAQEGGARRNNTVTARQETKAEKKQEKVDKAQYPTNVSNQAATDVKLRVTTDKEGSRRNGTDNRNSGSSNNGSVVNGGASSSSNANNNGYNSGRPANNGNNGNYSGNNGRPANGGNYGGNSGYNNGRPVNGGHNHNTPPPPPTHHSGNYGGYSGGGYIPGYADMYPGKRPPIPTVRNYSRYEAYERTNAAGIVVNTLFTSKMEAYDYIARLLRARYYNVASYGNNYDWIRSEVSFIPTPFDWTNPMTHNQFAMYFKITRVFGRVKVTITAQWRESVLSDRFSTLRFQPSNAYSTYYAWNVLEDIADNIPHTGVSYRTADLL